MCMKTTSLDAHHIITRSLLLDLRSIDISGAQENESHFHYRNILRTWRYQYLLNYSKISSLWIRLTHNPKYRDFGMIEQVWHVIPHFEALKKFL